MADTATNLEILPPPRNKLTVEIWSDIICPWCWIGLARFDKALQNFGHADDVKIVHHAYRLMPGVTPRLADEVVAAKMRVALTQVRSVFEQVEAVAAGEGLSYNLSGTFTGDTLDAHRLIKLAAMRGRGQETLESFYRGYLSEQISVLDRDSMLALAARAGLDREEAAAVLDGDAFHAEVDADQRSLQALCGNGVPFFLIGGRYAISGAQPAQVFAQALQKAWDERPVTISSGAVCDVDGCETT